MFFDVVIKVLNFIVSVIRVELPKITLHLLLFCKCRFVDVSCVCCSFFTIRVQIRAQVWRTSGIKSKRAPGAP